MATKKDWCGYIGLLVVLITLVVLIYHQITHPDDTKTRIFFNMWPWYVVAAFGAVGVVWGFDL